MLLIWVNLSVAFYLGWKWEIYGTILCMKSVGVSENGLWMDENKKTGEIEEFTDNI